MKLGKVLLILALSSLVLSAPALPQEEKPKQVSFCGKPLSFGWDNYGNVGHFPPAPGEVAGKVKLAASESLNKAAGNFSGVIGKTCEVGDMVYVYQHHWYGWAERPELEHAYTAPR